MTIGVGRLDRSIRSRELAREIGYIESTIACLPTIPKVVGCDDVILTDETSAQIRSLVSRDLQEQLQACRSEFDAL